MAKKPSKPPRPPKPPGVPSAPRTKHKGVKKKKLHDLTREFLTAEQIESYADELFGNDRTCALVGGASLDQLLMWLLIAHFSEAGREEIDTIFYDTNAVLGTFASRTTICFALGLITQEQRSDLISIRKIRNVFAHRIQPLSFDEPLIAKECRKLRSNHEAWSPRAVFTEATHFCYLELIKATNKKARIETLMPYITPYIRPSSQSRA